MKIAIITMISVACVLMQIRYIAQTLQIMIGTVMSGKEQKMDENCQKNETEQKKIFLDYIEDFAHTTKETYDSLVKEGFSAQEALELVKTLIMAGMKNAQK